MPWLPGVYDPDTKLYIFGTGNPIPAYTVGRGEGDNLYTCALIAVNVDTGKMAWYFQTSPHDMHDWDSAQTPVLIDGIVKGRKRKLVSTAARNGYFFTVDRVTGESVVSSKYGSSTNWVRCRPTHPRFRRQAPPLRRCGPQPREPAPATSHHCGPVKPARCGVMSLPAT